MADADTVVIRRHLQKLLSSEQMEKSEASQKLLRYLAERAVRGETPKETDIALDVFGRDASFNSASSFFACGLPERTYRAQASTPFATAESG